MIPATGWTILQNNSTFIVLLSAVVFLIYIYFKHAYSYWKRRGILSLEGDFLFGNIRTCVLRQAGLGENFRSIYKDLKERNVKYGGFYVLTRPSLMILEPELAKTMFIKNFNHFSDRGFYNNEQVDPLSTNLVGIGNPRWHQLRTMFSPTFSTAKMKMIFPIVANCGKHLVSALDHYAINDTPIISKDIMTRYTSDIIGKPTFIPLYQNFLQSSTCKDFDSFLLFSSFFQKPLT